MQLEERSVGDITIVAVKGDITLNKGSDVVLRDKVRSLIQQGRLKLIIDLGHVSHLFATGANDVLVVCGERERMIPFVLDQYVVSIDLDAGRMVVDWDADF